MMLTPAVIVLMLLMRDILITSQMAPFTIHYGENLPPKGKKLLLVVYGVIAGLHNLAHYYAVKVLPLGDVMMVSAVILPLELRGFGSAGHSRLLIKHLLHLLQRCLCRTQKAV